MSAASLPSHPDSMEAYDALSGSFQSSGLTSISATRTSGPPDSSAQRITYPISKYEFRNQSSRLFGDPDSYNTPDDNNGLLRDFAGRATVVSEMFIASLFTDADFGFSINEAFLKNSTGLFLTKDALINSDNFIDDEGASVFLNRMISTIADFFQSTDDRPFLNYIKPLRYFTALYANSPVPGSSMKRKPDLMLVRLLDGCIVDDAPLFWHHAQGFIEQTREKKVPIRMTETIVSKSYLAFCAQPERDFIINLCISGEGFRVVVMDHTGSVETTPISFDTPYGTYYFLRTVIGLAFFPDRLLGVDATMLRRDSRVCSNKQFQTAYPPYPRSATFSLSLFRSPQPRFPDTNPIAITTSPHLPNSNSEISSITVGSTTYPVISVLFNAKSLIGRSTKVFLVELPDGSRGILKDSWITTDRVQEAEFLKELDIPFGPSIRASTTLRNTDDFRTDVNSIAAINEPREKRRVVEGPAGVHISDFTSLWELTVAFLDVAIAILYLESKNKVHRDISYTNILLREPGDDPDEKKRIKEELQKELHLSAIVSLREELKSREGLLIDFDYATELGKERGAGDNEAMGGSLDDVNASGARTGTAPFIAIELLMYAAPHHVVHDLESLFFVLIFICSHLDGPCNTIRHPILYGVEGRESHPSPIRRWFAMNNLGDLGHLKSSMMFRHFEGGILSNISPYFTPLVPHLRRLWETLHPQRGAVMVPFDERHQYHSTAKVQDIIQVFKEALLDPVLIQQARASGTIRGKRAFPGELVSTPTGWDAARLDKKLLKAKPITSQSRTRKRTQPAILNTKRRRGA